MPSSNLIIELIEVLNDTSTTMEQKVVLTQKILDVMKDIPELYVTTKDGNFLNLIYKRTNLALHSREYKASEVYLKDADFKGGAYRTLKRIESVLTIAIENDQPEIIRLLLTAKMNPNYFIDPFNPDKGEHSYILSWASQDRPEILAEECVNALIVNGKADLEVGNGRSTALEMAITITHMKVAEKEDTELLPNFIAKIRILLSHGAIIRDPGYLFKVLQRLDKENWDVLYSLNKLCEQLHTPPKRDGIQIKSNPQLLERAFNYLEELKLKHSLRRDLVQQTLVDQSFPREMNIIAEYDTPSLDKSSLVFFKPIDKQENAIEEKAVNNRPMLDKTKASESCCAIF